MYWNMWSCNNSSTRLQQQVENNHNMTFSIHTLTICNCKFSSSTFGLKHSQINSIATNNFHTKTINNQIVRFFFFFYKNIIIFSKKLPSANALDSSNFKNIKFSIKSIKK
jgi:hypothetical protein